MADWCQLRGINMGPVHTTLRRSINLGETLFRKASEWKSTQTLIFARLLIYKSSIMSRTSLVTIDYVTVQTPYSTPTETIKGICSSVFDYFSACKLCTDIFLNKAIYKPKHTGTPLLRPGIPCLECLWAFDNIIWPFRTGIRRDFGTKSGLDLNDIGTYCYSLKIRWERRTLQQLNRFLALLLTFIEQEKLALIHFRPLSTN